jgi:hypothetical protein
MQDVQGAASINKDSVELDVLDNGANNERVPPRLWYKVRVVIVVEGDGDLRHFRYSEVAGETAMTSRAVSLCFLLDT